MCCNNNYAKKCNIDVGKSVPGKDLFTVELCLPWGVMGERWLVIGSNLVLDVSMPARLGVFPAVLHHSNCFTH